MSKYGQIVAKTKVRRTLDTAQQRLEITRVKTGRSARGDGDEYAVKDENFKRDASPRIVGRTQFLLLENRHRPAPLVGGAVRLPAAGAIIRVGRRG